MYLSTTLDAKNTIVIESQTIYTSTQHNHSHDHTTYRVRFLPKNLIFLGQVTYIPK